MKNHESQSERSRRTTKTKEALLNAFNELVLSSGKEQIRVGDIIRIADVGRSTFYDHFSGVEAIHNEAIRTPLVALADALAQSPEGYEQLIGLLDHLNMNKERAVASFASSSFRDQTTRVLAEMVDDRLERIDVANSPSLVARQLAESAMALIRVWITDEIECEMQQLAETIVQTAELLRGGLCD